MPIPTELIIRFLALFAVVYPLVLLFIYLARGVLWWFAGARGGRGNSGQLLRWIS